MKFSAENLKLREKFLTPEFVKSLQNLQTENDVFTTNSTDFPRAFRLGNCEVFEPNKTNFEILLFWRDETRSEQKSINAEVVKQGDKWLINKICNESSLTVRVGILPISESKMLSRQPTRRWR